MRRARIDTNALEIGRVTGIHTIISGARFLSYIFPCESYRFTSLERYTDIYKPKTPPNLNKWIRDVSPATVTAIAANLFTGEVASHPLCIIHWLSGRYDIVNKELFDGRVRQCLRRIGLQKD